MHDGRGALSDGAHQNPCDQSCGSQGFGFGLGAQSFGLGPRVQFSLSKGHEGQWSFVDVPSCRLLLATVPRHEVLAIHACLEHKKLNLPPQLR